MFQLNILINGHTDERYLAKLVYVSSEGFTSTYLGQFRSLREIAVSAQELVDRMKRGEQARAQMLAPWIKR